MVLKWLRKCSSVLEPLQMNGMLSQPIYNSFLIKAGDALNTSN